MMPGKVENPNPPILTDLVSFFPSSLSQPTPFPKLLLSLSGAKRAGFFFSFFFLTFLLTSPSL